MTILGIDPGTQHLGWALLTVDEQTRKGSVELMGVLDLSKYADHYQKLAAIQRRMVQLMDEYKPDEMGIESPFFGKNVQSMLKLGRAQGVCIAQAAVRGIPVAEYAPMRIKQSITGKGDAEKETVAAMLKRMLNFESVPKLLDATDALACAYCHYLQISSPLKKVELNDKQKQLKKLTARKRKGSGSSWDDFVKNNPERVVDK